MTKGKDPDCPKCGENRWKTVKKYEKWQCQPCGFVAEIGTPWIPAVDENYLKLEDIGSIPTFTGDNKYPVKIPWWRRFWGWMWK